MNHGGKRIRAGRKPRLDGQGRNITKSFRASRDVADYISANGTRVIETTIRNSKQFKDWMKQKNS